MPTTDGGNRWVAHVNLILPIFRSEGVDSDWRDPKTYDWMTALPRTAWAWEFLRRNPKYREVYVKHLADTGDHDVPVHRDALPWGLLRLADPALDVRRADVLWQMKVCREVLPLAASVMRPGTAAATLRLSGLRCRTTLYDYGVEERREVLFAQEGRALQLTIFGNVPLEEALLLTPALPVLSHSKSRLLSARRLADLVKHGWLRPALYKRERQNSRLARVAQALDGWLAQAPQRAIGDALFASDRVARDWNDPRNHLRDHVRRAISYGRSLMAGKYRRFLS
jgi:hypothetical protein